MTSSRYKRCGLLNRHTSVYRIREVDGRDDEITDILTELHRLTFFSGASVPPFDWGHWWLAYREATPVAFAGVVPSTHIRNAGYFCRVGVLQRHWGHRLQLRLMRADGSAGTAQWLALRGVRYDRQYRFRQQFHPCRLSDVSAAVIRGRFRIRFTGARAFPTLLLIAPIRKERNGAAARLT